MSTEPGPAAGPAATPAPGPEVAPAPGVEVAGVPVYRSAGLGFRTRLTLGLIVAAVLPVLGFGIVVLLATGAAGDASSNLMRVLLFAVAIAVVFAVLLAAYLAADLGAPLRAIARSVERVSAGDLATRLELPGDDEFSRLAESHNRLAGDLERRNRELRRILDSLGAVTLHERPEVLAQRAGEQARAAFGMIDCAILLVDPREIPIEEPVPGFPKFSSPGFLRAISTNSLMVPAGIEGWTSATL